ncbi:VOC family protein [Octadecabacter sp. 1_MG-2023]|nr:VOC family protein [Octadecabacter sp. B2R22]MDO6735706.1 VOC family protein [Octadecabacter sp. 1_MG-2023]
MNYFVVGTNNMDATITFYDALFDTLGMNKMIPSDRMTYWLGDDFAFAAALPFDEQPATVGNGTMVGFSLGSADEVKRVYEKAIALGGTSEGEPGQRGPRFSAYVRDLDKNKICLSD